MEPLLSISSQMPDSWVLHDYLQVNGGAERLVLTLTKGLPSFQLGVSGIYPGFTQTGDLMGLSPAILTGKFPRIPRAWLTFSGLKLPKNSKHVLYSGIYAPLAVKNQTHGRKLLYCHTPPRFAFDRESEYVGKVNVLLRPAMEFAIARYRRSYLEAVRSMDHVVTNSQYVRKRLLDLTGVDSTVVYPPTDLERFGWRGQGDYFLSLGRLEPNKRVDRVVKAFLKMPDKKLVVASGGSQLPALKALAAGAPNIHFTGWIDEPTLISWVGNSLACIYIPKDEDFGMSTVEAMSAGKPVIGVDEGGLRETIDHGVTGLLLAEDPGVEQIVEAVRMLSAELAVDMRTDCERRADLFSKEKFLTAMHRLIYPERVGVES
jgi:glycosyltransferase involved in cell wall biosynthesis